MFIALDYNDWNKLSKIICQQEKLAEVFRKERAYFTEKLDFFMKKLSLHFFKHKQVYSGQDHLNICEQPQFLGEKIYWSGFCLIGFALPIVVTVYCYIRIIQEVQEAKLRVKTIGRNIIKK